LLETLLLGLNPTT